MLPQFATVARRLGHLEDARQALVRYTVLVDDDREQAAHATRIADLSLELNDPTAAVGWYEKSEALSAPDAVLLAHLADAQFKTGQLDAAEATIARALAKDAQDPVVRAVARRLQALQVR